MNRKELAVQNALKKIKSIDKSLSFIEQRQVFVNQARNKLKTQRNYYKKIVEKNL